MTLLHLLILSVKSCHFLGSFDLSVLLLSTNKFSFNFVCLSNSLVAFFNSKLDFVRVSLFPSNLSNMLLSLSKLNFSIVSNKENTDSLLRSIFSTKSSRPILSAKSNSSTFLLSNNSLSYPAFTKFSIPDNVGLPLLSFLK